MGSDSFTLQQSFWIRNLIMQLLLEQCHCYVYQEGHSCVRCYRLGEAARLFPIQHMSASNDYLDYRKRTDGVQP